MASIIFDAFSAAVLGPLIAGFILSFILGFGIGANDVANAFCSTYGAKLLKLWQIVLSASIFELAGAMLIGLKVSETVRSGIISLDDIQLAYENSPNCLNPLYITNMTSVASTSSLQQNGTIGCPEMIQLIGSVSSLAASGLWMVIANLARMPVSSTHSIVGSTIGYALIALRGKGVAWIQLASIVGSWFLSPVASGVVSCLIYLLIDYGILRRKNSFEVGLKVMPLFYFFTVFVISFSIFYEGSSLLYFDRIPLWGVFVLCLGLATIVSLAVFIFLTPYLRKKLLTIEQRAQNPIHQINKETVTLQNSEINNGVNNITVVTPSLNEHVDSNAQKEVNVTPLENNTNILSTSTSQNITTNPNIPTANTQTENSDLTIIHTNVDERESATLVKTKEDPRTFFMFRTLQIMAACYGSFTHGGSDVSNSIAPLMSLWLIFKNGKSAEHVVPPVWLLFYGGIGIVFGLSIWGQGVLRRLGCDITTITPATGFSIEFGSVITVLTMTKVGLPISTTHCTTGSIIAVGWLKYGRKSVDLKIISGIAMSWFVTVPVSALLAAFIYFSIHSLIFRL